MRDQGSADGTDGGSEYSALRVRTENFGRFGNSVIRCCNSILVARQLAIPVVIWPSTEMISPVTGVHGPTLVAAAGHAIPKERIYDDPKGVNFLDLNKAFHGRELELRTPEAVIALAQTHLRPSINPRCYARSESVKADDLVVHFRSGDLFEEKKKTNPVYWQPPLSFYVMALAQHLGDHPGAQVHLVFEDRGNPVIGAFEAHCRKREVEVMVHSVSLISDIAILLSARHLVFGQGSFSPILALLSKQSLQSVWFLRESIPFVVRVLRHQGVRVNKVIPSLSEDYIREWRNTPEQHRMMLEYPVENLSIDGRS